jgi:hypothetical protein
MSKLQQLTRQFELAGAADPSSWAQSEIDDNIPQLARYLFLRQAWRQVIAEGDEAWIQREIDRAHQRPGAPGTGLGVALERMIADGANTADISEVARTVQWQLLARMCYQLSNPSIEESELQHVAWVLVEVDSNGNRGRSIAGLHESVLETDPTGREMHPKPIG